MSDGTRTAPLRHAADSALTPPEWELWRTLRSMNRQLDRELDRRLQKDVGISQADYGVLLALSSAPDRQLRVGELAELLAWEKSRVSHQLSRMESRGFIERTDCSQDARGTWVSVTAEGRRTFLSATRGHEAAVSEIFVSHLTADEKTALHAVALRVIEGLAPSCDETGCAE